MLEALRRLLPAIVRHLLTYGELLYDETGDALHDLRRRAFGLAIALAAGWSAVMFGCLLIVAATWNGPNRLVALGALCGAFVLIAVLSALIATRPAARPRPFERLRAEWREDMEELMALSPSLSEPRDYARREAPAGAKPQAAHVS